MGARLPSGGNVEIEKPEINTHYEVTC